MKRQTPTSEWSRDFREGTQSEFWRRVHVWGYIMLIIILLNRTNASTRPLRRFECDKIIIIILNIAYTDDGDGVRRAPVFRVYASCRTPRPFDRAGRAGDPYYGPKSRWGRDRRASPRGYIKTIRKQTHAHTPTHKNKRVYGALVLLLLLLL